MASDLELLKLAPRLSSVYLITPDFDELLEPVNDEELVLVIVISDVPGVEPLVRTDCVRGGLWVVEVSLHYLVSQHQLVSERFLD